ncbi:MAG: hypothetical protein K6C99_02950 [Lachnospiraceae bacterium]|nr:hypothetical protein [Lachnospiraceae bacterium]
MNTFKVSRLDEPAKEKHDLSHVQTMNCRINIGGRFDLEKISKTADRRIEISLAGIDDENRLEETIQVLKDCKRLDLEFRTIACQGDILLKKYKGKPLCRYLIEYDCIYNINIDMQGCRLSEGELSKLAFFFWANGAEMRLSFETEEGKTDSFDKIIDLIEKYSKLGIYSLIFREKKVALKNIFDPKYPGMNYLRSLEDDRYRVGIYRLEVGENKYLAKHYMEKVKV